MDAYIMGEQVINYRRILETREKLLEVEPQGPRILIVENIDIYAVQLLGTVLALDPTFLLDYLEPVGKTFSISKLVRANRQFSEVVKTNKDDAGEIDNDESHTAIIVAAPAPWKERASVHLTGQCRDVTRYARVSCYRESQHGCNSHDPDHGCSYIPLDIDHI